MSDYNARRAPNVSAYLANLNTIPSAQELAAQQNAIDFNDNLEFFTNTEFFDFDQFNPVDQGFPAGNGPLPSNDGVVEGAKGVGMNGAQFPQFGEFQTYPPTVASTPSYAHQSPTTGLNYSPSQIGDKRKAGQAGPADLEEQSRHAAEEDKRRRNTAASARFRVKKKQREQELEKKSKEMADKVSALEGKVMQLEMENKWLKGLITDKNGVTVPEMKVGKVSEGVKEKAEEERSLESVKRGIGTEEVESEEE